MINIVTPTTRTDNLQAIADSLSGNINIVWWVIFDGSVKENRTIPHITENIKLEVVDSKENAVAGHLHRNFVIEQLNNDDWYYSIDDDNIIHPLFLQELTENRNAIVVEQILKDGQLRLYANIPRMGVIDTAQFALRKSVIGNVRFKNVYEGDGLFIEDVYNKHPDEFTFINSPLCYYNYLR